MTETATLRDIVILGRLPFLAGGFLLFCVGALLALLSGASFAPWRFLFGYAIFFTAQLSLSYSNNYFDVEADRHSEKTPISGGSAVLVRRPELRPFAIRFALALVIASLVLAVAFVVTYGHPWWFVGFVAGGNALGWFYTAPPLRLAYRGWGEMATALTYAFLMPGIGYLTFMQQFHWLFLFLAVPLLLYGLDFILTVELPDLESDRRAVKRTWVVRWGRRVSLAVIVAALLSGTALFAAFDLLGVVDAPFDFRVVALFSLVPLAIGLLGVHRWRDTREHIEQIALGNIAGLNLFIIATITYFVFLLR